MSPRIAVTWSQHDRLEIAQIGHLHLLQEGWLTHQQFTITPIRTTLTIVFRKNETTEPIFKIYRSRMSN